MLHHRRHHQYHHHQHRPNLCLRGGGTVKDEYKIFISKVFIGGESGMQKSVFNLKVSVDLRVSGWQEVSG